VFHNGYRVAFRLNEKLPFLICVTFAWILNAMSSPQAFD